MHDSEPVQRCIPSVTDMFTTESVTSRQTLRAKLISQRPTPMLVIFWIRVGLRSRRGTNQGVKQAISHEIGACH